MSDITILEMLAGLRAQKEKIDRAIAALEPLAGLQSESQWEASAPKVKRRAVKRASVRGVARQHEKTEASKSFKAGSGYIIAMKVISEAAQPLNTQEFLKGLLAAGWKTTGDPSNNAQQTLYHLVKRGLVQRFGKPPYATYGLPGQKPTEPQLFDDNASHLSIPALAVEVIAAAKQPLSTSEVVTRMQARGWSTASAKPGDVVRGGLMDAVQRGKAKRYGKGAHGVWGLPGWGNAVKVMRAVQKSNGAMQEG